MLKKFFLILIGAIFLCIGCGNDSSTESQKNYEATATAPSASVVSEPLQEEKPLEGISTRLHGCAVLIILIPKNAR